MEVEVEEERGLSFSVTFEPALTQEAQDGRLLLLLATHDKDEPRFLADDSAQAQLIFG